MSAVNNAGSAGNAASSQSSSKSQGNDLRDMDLNDFLNLLVTELQNQDPMNPMDNSQMVQQLSTIREIGATNQLSETLTNLSITQQLTTASSLMGRKVDGLADDGKEVSGKVDQVSVETSDSGTTSERKIKVHVGGKTMDVKNIRQIQPDG